MKLSFLCPGKFAQRMLKRMERCQGYFSMSALYKIRLYAAM